MFRSLLPTLASLFMTLLVLASCGQSTQSNGTVFTRSNPVTTVPTDVPMIPSNLAIGDGSVGQECIIKVSWEDQSDNETRFELERHHYINLIDNEPIVLIFSYGTDLDDAQYIGIRELGDTLSEPTYFIRYRVRSVNEAGSSDWTDFSDYSPLDCFN